MSSADRRVPALPATLVVLIALTVIVPAIRLHANGLWADELFTAYFSDPGPSWGAALLRAAEDIHPPIYAMIVRLLRLASGGDAATAARGFALACSVATLSVLAVALRWRMGWLALLFTLAAVAQSGPFLLAVTEARSYALANLLLTIDIALVLALLSSGAGWRGRLPLAILLVLGGLVHSYLALVGVALALYLALVEQDRRWRAVWVLVAVLVVGTAQAAARWQAPYVVVDVTHSWFSAAPVEQVSYIVRGTVLAIASPLGLAALLLAFRAVPWRHFGARPFAWQPMLRTPAAFAIFAIALTAAGAVAYTTLFVPVLSRRLFMVLAPFFWLLAGEVFRVALDRPSRPVTAVLLAVAAFGAVRAFDAGQQVAEPWRESAQALRAIPECANAPIAVSGLQGPAVRGSEAAIFYGYYDPGSSDLRLISRKAPAPEKADRVLAIHGASACPVLLWSVHHLRRDQMLALAELVRRDPRLPRGFDVAVEAFAAPRPVALLPHFARADAKPIGFFLRLKPQS
jgi:hypothetical protein